MTWVTHPPPTTEDERAMLYRRDPLTLEHLIIDGDEVLRLRTRVEALEIAHRRRRRAARSTSPRLAVS